DGDPSGLVEREATDAGAHRRKGDAPGADVAGARHRAADRLVDDVGVRSAIAVEGDGMDHGSGRERSGGRDDCLAEGHGRLAHGGELDRIAACTLDLATDPCRHPQREVGGVHDRVDLEVADVAVPEFDASQLVSWGASAREPVSPAGASYTRVRRPDMAVTTSQELVVRHRATSAAVISERPCAPIRTTSSSTSTGRSGTSVTSIIVASIATFPTTGTRTPRTRASARFDRERGQPSPYPRGKVAMRLGREARHVGPYDTPWPAGRSATRTGRARSERTERSRAASGRSSPDPIPADAS